MNDALDWAEQYVAITKDERNVIIKSKYAFLFHNNRAWVKRTGSFDNGMAWYSRKHRPHWPVPALTNPTPGNGNGKIS